MFVRNFILTFIFALVFMSFSTSAVSYYNGNVSVEQIIGYTTINDTQSAQVVMSYALKNSGSSSTQITISFPGFPDDAKYNVSETRGRDLRINLPVGVTNVLVIFNQNFDSSSRLSLSPGYRLDDKLPVKKVLQQQYTFEFKSNEISLLSSEPEISIVGQNLYTFVDSNSYPKTLKVNVANKNIRAYAYRTVSAYSQVGDVINLATTIINTGSASLDGLSLEDSIFATYFEPNSSGFTHYQSSGIGEELYIYNQALPILKPGENYTINYAVKVVRMRSLPFTGARILYKGNFLTSTDASEPIIFPLQVAQQINPVDVEEADSKALKEDFPPIEPEVINDTINPGEQAPIFRPEEKEVFNQQIKRENRGENIFTIIIIIFLFLILGASYLAWNKYKVIIIESFSSLDLSSLKFWEKNINEDK
ncbi:MAG: hypothetical protein Q7R87_03985 [Nanoarchaeota archaeon]|nr:hypothetical protein [Nanoarchaeota archaeon]